MKTQLFPMLCLLCYQSAWSIEATCSQITLIFDDPYATQTIRAEDLIESITGGIAPFSYAFYSPDGPSEASFSCLQEGTIELEVNVIDSDGNVSSCLGVIQVISDLGLAEQLCNIGFATELNQNGQAAMEDFTPELVSQYCGIQSISYSPSLFSCQDIGTHPVTISVTKVNGDGFSCIVNVWVFDQHSPVITCPASVSLDLPYNGQLTISADQLGISVVDNCESIVPILSKTAFDCSDLGIQTVDATAFAADGSSVNCHVSITISDPNMYCTPQAYCIASGTSSSEFIDRIALGTLSHETGDDGGYGDHMDQRTAFVPGKNYPYSLTPGFATEVEFRLDWQIWVDSDRNGSFETEELIIWKKNKKGTVRGKLKLPKNAKPGLTRARLLVSRTAPPSPCFDIPFGEYEDYTIVIEPNVVADGTNPSMRDNFLPQQNPRQLHPISFFPNPANSFIHLRYAEGEIVSRLTIYDLMSRPVVSKIFDQDIDLDSGIIISDLDPGVYIVIIETRSGVHTRKLQIIR